MKTFVLIVPLTVFALSLSAQNFKGKDTGVGDVTIVHTAEINAAAQANKGRAVADSVLRVTSIDGKYNVGVSVVSRSRINGKTPPDAIVHDAITEVYHIVEGKGILLVGGTLDSSVRIPADNPIVLKITGPTSTGKRITGGAQHKIVPGDVVVIPPNTPHGFIEITTDTIVYTVIRIDNEKLLELKD